MLTKNRFERNIRQPVNVEVNMLLDGKTQEMRLKIIKELLLIIGSKNTGIKSLNLKYISNHDLLLLYVSDPLNSLCGNLKNNNIITSKGENLINILCKLSILEAINRELKSVNIKHENVSKKVEKHNSKFLLLCTDAQKKYQTDLLKEHKQYAQSNRSNRSFLDSYKMRALLIFLLVIHTYSKIMAAKFLYKQGKSPLVPIVNMFAAPTIGYKLYSKRKSIAGFFTNQQSTRREKILALTEADITKNIEELSQRVKDAFEKQNQTYTPEKLTNK
jgi:hypothetical protein